MIGYGWWGSDLVAQGRIPQPPSEVSRADPAKSPGQQTRFQTCLITTGKSETQVRVRSSDGNMGQTQTQQLPGKSVVMRQGRKSGHGLRSKSRGSMARLSCNTAGATHIYNIVHAWTEGPGLN